ncbi:FMN reductase [Streptomyces sp. NBC_00370]|uniref:FMN reductase n=1 Tax=Streptomyces sp. NBC_00370 TaxID=2975728 RepID=UPI002E262891
METLKLVVVSAGLGKPSSSRLLADRLAEAATGALAGADRKTDVRVVELRDLAVAVANNLVTGFPAADLRDALAAVGEADGLIVVTPVFAGSYSGLFKSFFDLIEPDALTGTPVLLAATGGTARHSLVTEHALRPLFSYLHALTAPTSVFAATDDWGAGADTHAGGLPARIRRAAEELAGLLGGTAKAPTADADDDADEIVPFEQLLRGH